LSQPRQPDARQPRALADLAGWVPFDLSDQAGETVVQWIHLGDLDFVDPFFRDTVNRRRKSADARIIRTGLQPLSELPALAPHLRPNGFVFHASRAGSTLFSNALKAMDDNLVLVEPNPLNQMLGSPARGKHPAMWDQLFRGLTACLGQPRRDTQTRYFIKFSSHNVLQIDDILRCFPDVPWVFLYRNPAEIIASALKDAPGWLAHFEAPEKAEATFAIQASEVRRMDRTEYCAAVLERFLGAALAAGEHGGRFVNYRDLEPETIANLLRTFGLEPSRTEELRMRDLFNYDSKAKRKTRFRGRGGVPAERPEGSCPNSLLRKFQDFEERAFVPKRALD